MAWREPQAAPQGAAVASQQRSVDVFHGHVIDRVDLAPLASSPDYSDDRPVPPGLERFPRDGDIYVSPALLRLLDETADEELGDRFPGKVEGVIGAAGLAHEDELVVVVGRSVGDLIPDLEAPTGHQDDRSRSRASAVLPIATFATSGHDENLMAYGQAVAVVVLLIAAPAVLLVGSAARLTAARRNQRLAALRLAGATPGDIVTLTTVETALAAFLGAAAGVAMYAAFLPITAKFSLAGGPWSAIDLWLGIRPTLLTLAAVPLIGAASATLALRQVRISPLGVAQRVSGRHPRAVRFLAMAGAWIVLVVAAISGQVGGGIAALLVGIGAVIGSLALVGPWIAWALGRTLAALSRRPATLLAARRILDDPKAAYRSVSGIVLAGFIAGFLFALGPAVDKADLGNTESHSMSMTLKGDLDPTIAPAANARLAAAGLSASVETDDYVGDTWGLWVEPESADDLERVRTALHGLVPAHPLVGDRDGLHPNGNRFEDFRRASAALLMIALVLAGTATAIGSAASVLDQRVTLARLRLTGTPVGVLQRARVWHATLPLVAATTMSVVTGMLTAYTLLAASGAEREEFQPPNVLSIATVLILGVAIGVASAAITRPLLVTTTAEPV
jgi:hypothetical protein